MKDFDALKNIWHGQDESPEIDYNELLRKVRSVRSIFSNRLLFQLIILSAAIIAMVVMLFSVPFKMATSHTAVIIFIVCCVIYLIIQLRDYRKIRNSENLLRAPDEYIAYLKSYKQARYILNTRIYRIYMMCMGLGFALCFIELFYFVSLITTVLAVCFTIAWFAISYFIFMKRYIRREEARLNEMIRNLERLRQQFQEEVANGN
jgi:hypothetical protein